MTPNEFQKLWTEQGDILISFPSDRVIQLQIPDESKAFLISPGIPAEGAPFLTFGERADLQLSTVAEMWHQPNEFEGYRIIGSDGPGDPICVDERADGRVVYLNHDNEFSVGFINSSVPQLAYSLLAFRKVVEQTKQINGLDAFLAGKIPANVVDEFITKMDSIDPNAIKADTFWFRSILMEGI